MKKMNKWLIGGMASVCALTLTLGVSTLSANADNANEHYIYGASARMIAPSGIRFKTVVKGSAVKDAPVVKYGTLVIPTSYLNGETLDINNAEAENVECELYETGTNEYAYNAVVYDIPAWGYARELTACSYVAYGESETSLTYEYTATVQRSIAQVAENALLDTNFGYSPDDLVALAKISDGAYAYDYSNETFADVFAPIGTATATIADGKLTATVVAEGDGVQIPFGDLDVSKINGIFVNTTAVDVAVSANGVSLGEFTADENGIDLTSALKASSVDCLSTLELTSATAGEIVIDGVVVQATRNVNVLKIMDEYSAWQGVQAEKTGDISYNLVNDATNFGANTRKVLQMTINKDKEGAVIFPLEAKDANFAGYDGLRFWFNGKGSNNLVMEVRLSDGTNYLSANIEVIQNDKTYITIPFSAFKGENVELKDVNAIEFHFVKTTSAAAYMAITDISVGTGGEYLVDNRANFTPYSIITVDTPFETFDTSAAINNWTLVRDTSVNSDLTKSWQGSTRNGLKIYDASFGAYTYTLRATQYSFAISDLTSANGFRFAIDAYAANPNNSMTGTLKVTIGSEGNYYETVRTLYNNDTVKYMVCDFAGMKLASGSSGELDKSKIDTIQITYTSTNSSMAAHQFEIDDLEFYSAKVGAKGTITPAKWNTLSNWNTNSGTALDTSTGVVTQSSTTKNPGYIQLNEGSGSDKQNTYGIRFKLNATNVEKIRVRVCLGASGNNYSIYLTDIVDGEQEIIVYYNQMSVGGTLTSMKWQYYLFDITYKTGTTGSVAISDYELLVG